jgi:hypothetical protein
MPYPIGALIGPEGLYYRVPQGKNSRLQDFKRFRVTSRDFIRLQETSKNFMRVQGLHETL